MQLTRRTVFLTLSAIAAAGLGSVGLRAATLRYYQGPASDHFDGVHFFDTHGMPPRSLAELLRWQLAGGKAVWPAWAPSPYTDRPPARPRRRRDLAHLLCRPCEPADPDGRPERND